MHYENLQIMFVDGEELLSDPASVMDQVQHFLAVHIILDYTKILSFVLCPQSSHLCCFVLCTCSVCVDVIVIVCF